MKVLEGELSRQAAYWSYVDAFRWVAVACLACIPIVLAPKSGKFINKPGLVTDHQAIERL